MKLAETKVTIRAAAKGGFSKTVTTDEAGRFVIRSVPVGDYKLRASRIYRNNYRTKELSVKVPAPPKKLPPLVLQVR